MAPVTSDVVIVHDWIARVGGAERVLVELARLFPSAPILTLFAERGALKHLGIDPRRVQLSYLHRVPGALRFRRFLLPLFADAVQSLDVGDASVILSSSHAVAKNVPHRSYQRHVAYVYSPMRYAHDLLLEYIRTVPAPLRPVIRSVLRDLAVWDVACAAAVDQYVAISSTVADRIRHTYGRAACVVHPPVDVAAVPFAADASRGDYYAVLSRLVAYKRVEVAIEAVARRGSRLLVIGDGPERGHLEALGRRLGAAGRVSFVGLVGEARKYELLAGARALLFPGEEDFGIVGVEALACGTPVIALGRGGMLDVLADGEVPLPRGDPVRVPGGVLFARPTTEDLAEALRCFDHEPLPSRTALRARAAQFDSEHFREKMRALVERAGLD